MALICESEAKEIYRKNNHEGSSFAICMVV